MVEESRFDLLLKGGYVIDPKNAIDGSNDIAIRNGRIAAVAPELSAGHAAKTISLHGLTITPGLIDLHVHLYYNTGVPSVWAGDNSVPPDAFSFRAGVTTMVDAGTAGWRNYDAFRAAVIERAQTRVFAFVNISGLGMTSNAAEQADFNPEEAARIARKHADVAVGIKTAHYQSPDWHAVDSALQAGRIAAVPVMVDFGYFLPERPYWRLLDERLRPGDITTHMFRGPVPWLDTEGKVHDYLKRARARGIIFDVGHGGASFVFRNAVPAVEQGFYPDSISTDLHAVSMNAAMMDMPTTMSKFLAMGMPLFEVVRASTVTPARIIGHEEIGSLTLGAAADIAVWKIEEGQFGFYDCYGGMLPGRQRLHCEMTLKDGRIAWDWNGRSATDYHQLGAEYGIWEQDKIVHPPAV